MRQLRVVNHLRVFIITFVLNYRFTFVITFYALSTTTFLINGLFMIQA